MNTDQQPAYGIIDPDYARVFTIARCLAWQQGYCLAMHGSFTRDLDLIAIPWDASACEPQHLINRICDAAELRENGHPPGDKAHGRKAWTLMFKTFGDPRFIDISFTPRLTTPPTDMVKMTREGEPLSYTGRQPDNIVAWRIGKACSKAAADPRCGDYIDRGLILMKELQAKGYGICAIVAQHMPEESK